MPTDIHDGGASKIREINNKYHSNETIDITDDEEDKCYDEKKEETLNWRIYDDTEMFDIDTVKFEDNVKWKKDIELKLSQHLKQVSMLTKNTKEK